MLILADVMRNRVAAAKPSIAAAEHRENHVPTSMKQKPDHVVSTAKVQRGGEIAMTFTSIRNLGVAVLALGATAAAATAPASARDGAVAAGVLGGLAAGAIVGSAAANAAPAYGYGYPAPAYAPPPAYDGGCYFTRQATYDPYGNFAGYRRVRVCE